MSEPPFFAESFFQIFEPELGETNWCEELTFKTADGFVIDAIKFGDDALKGAGIGNVFVAIPEMVIIFEENFFDFGIFITEVEHDFALFFNKMGFAGNVAEKIFGEFGAIAKSLTKGLKPVFKNIFKV